MCKCFSSASVGTVFELLYRQRAALWTPVHNPYPMLDDFAELYETLRPDDIMADTGGRAARSWLFLKTVRQPDDNMSCNDGARASLPWVSSSRRCATRTTTCPATTGIELRCLGFHPQDNAPPGRQHVLQIRGLSRAALGFILKTMRHPDDNMSCNDGD